MHSALRTRRRWLLGWLIVLGLMRLWLMAGEEVIPTPMDPENYARGILYYGTGTVDDWIPMQRPGLSLLARAMTELGIPYSLGIQLTWLVVAGVAALTLLRATGNLVLAVVVDLLLVFCPWYWKICRMLMTEPVTAVVMLALGIALAPFFLRPPQRWQGRFLVLPSLLSSIWILTRPESLVLIGFWGIVAVALLGAHGRALCGRSLLTRFAWVLVPLLVAWLCQTGMKFFHGEHFGVHAMSVTETPGFMKLMDALYSIAPSKPQRFIPIPKETLERACAESPTLAAYRDKLLSFRPDYLASCRDQTGIDGEVGPMVNWHVVESLHSPHREKVMTAAAQELRKAMHEGRLPSRWGKYPIDPLWPEWLGELPATYWQAVRAGTWQRTFPTAFRFLFSETLKVDPDSRARFESGLLLRSSLLTHRRMQVLVRLFDASESQFSVVRLRTESGRELARQVLWSNRGIVLAEVSADVSSVMAGETMQLEFETSEGNVRATLPVQCRTDQFHRMLSGVEGRPAESWGADVKVRPRPRFSTRERWKDRIDAGYVPASWLALAACLLAGGLSRISATRRRRLFWWCVSILALVACRAAYYTLVEVWLRWGLHRYVEPNQVPLLLGACLMLFWCGAKLRSLGIVRLPKGPPGSTGAGPV